MKADPLARPSCADRGGAERPPRRAAVRQALAAHADDVRDGGPRARRSCRRAAAGRRARPARAGRRRGAQSRTVGRCRRSSERSRSVLQEFAGGDAPPARGERAHRRRAPVPGDRGLPDAAGASGPAARAGRSPTSATATTSPRRSRTRPPCWASTSTSPAPRRISCRMPSSSRRRTRPATARGCGCSPSRPMRSPARMPSTLTRGRRWGRKPKPRFGAAFSRRIR